MNTIKIKNVEIGKGIPKICIPLTGKNREEIIEEMQSWMCKKMPTE